MDRRIGISSMLKWFRQAVSQAVTGKTSSLASSLASDQPVKPKTAIITHRSNAAGPHP
jgi:hypothetical protein